MSTGVTVGSLCISGGKEIIDERTTEQRECRTRSRSAADEIAGPLRFSSGEEINNLI